MSYSYISNLKGGYLILRDGYTYPTHPHPHKEFLSSEIKVALGTLFIKALPTAVHHEVLTRKITATQYFTGKEDILLYHGLTKDHVELLDNIISEAMRHGGKFARQGITEFQFDTEEGIQDWSNALKAAIEYYFYEPIFPEAVQEILREKGVMHKKRVNLKQEQLDEFEKKKPRTWDVVE